MLTSFLFLFLIRATSPNSRRSFRNILSSPFEHRRVLNIDYHYFLDDHGDDFLIIFAARDKRWIVRRLRFPPLRLATTRRRTSVTGLSRKWVSVHSSFPLHRLYNFLQPRVFQTLLPSPSFENCIFTRFLRGTLPSILNPPRLGIVLVARTCQELYEKKRKKEESW